MVNLVKTIESTIKTDQKQMKFLKRQLRTNPSEINKLRQSTLFPERMIAPIHAAVQSDNIEILEHILAMKDVYVDNAALVRTCLNRTVQVGVIWIALQENPKNLDILKLLLEHLQRPWIVMVQYPELDMMLPGCLVNAVEKERLDLLEVLLGKAELLEREVKMASLASFYGEAVKAFTIFSCLAIAVGSNKPGVFRHLLSLPSFQVNDLYQVLPRKGRLVTLLEFARIHKRTEMCEQLEQILNDTNTEEGEEDTDEHMQIKKKIAGNDAETALLRGVIDHVAGRVVDQIVEENKNLVKVDVNKISVKKECTKEKKAKSKKYVVEGGTDENDNFVQNGTGEKNDDVDPVKISGISIDKVSIVDDHVTDCIINRIADQIADRLNVKKENPCPKVRSVDRRKNKMRGSRENSILEGNGAEANCDNLKEDEDAVASRVRKPKYCWNCVNISNFTCSGCRKAKYCEEKCQWEDWESHKEYCLVRMNQIAFKEFESLSASLFD